MSAPVVVGDILAQKYRVERVLGQGGMGVVVAARHVELEELVAIKFLLPEMLNVPDAVPRFLREARAAARVKSEHVARVSDVGQLETGAPYMVMEYLPGVDLAALLQERGALSVDEAVDYVAQACEAIADAHALGIVHRDLKPANLMLVPRSDGSKCVKLLDFGISKVVSGVSTDGAMTRTAAVMGSPLYMSPEQMTSARDVDGRTDVWSLGTILYELVTGKAPFDSDTLPGLAIMIATQEHPPMRDLRPGIPAGLDAVAKRCLAKRREDRYPNVGDLAAALAPFAPDRARLSIERASRILQAAAATSIGGAPAAIGPSSETGPSRLSSARAEVATAANWGETAHRESPKKTTIVATLAGLAVAIAIAGAWVVLGRTPAAPAASVPATAPSRPPEPAPSPAVPSVVPALQVSAQHPDAGIRESTKQVPSRKPVSVPALRSAHQPATKASPEKSRHTAYDDM